MILIYDILIILDGIVRLHPLKRDVEHEGESGHLIVVVHPSAEMIGNVIERKIRIVGKFF